LSNIGTIYAEQFPWIVEATRFRESEFFNDDLKTFAKLQVHEPVITLNHSSRAWQGIHWNYRIPNAETGQAEEFMIYIIDKTSSAQEPAAEAARREFEARDQALRKLDGRDNWFCEIIVGCLDKTAYFTQISVDKVKAVSKGIDRFLTKDNNKNLKLIIEKGIVDFAVAIVSNLVSYFITLKFEVNTNSGGSTDSCK
jgi:hypothetical protein